MNLVFYVVDCLRADHVHALGYGRATTPALDALARQGAVATRFYAQGGWTAPSAASMLSGLLPSRTGVHCMRDSLRADLPWFPELLQRSGWNTAAFSAMVQVSAHFGFARGFDTFVDAFREPEVVRACAARGQGVRDPSHCLPLSEDLHALALRWLDTRRDARPFFMFVWSIDTHEPFRQPGRCNVDADPSYRGPIDGSGRPFSRVRNARDRQQVIDLYDGALRYQDEQLGRLVAEFERRGVLDDTLIVVVGDHGEMFWEHGLAGHGKFPWEEELRVPCVLRHPRSVRAGTVHDALASNLDLAPTLLNLLGLPAPTRTDGESFASALAGQSSSARDTLLIEVPSPFDRREHASVVLDQRWKYVRYVPPVKARRARRAAKETGRWLVSLARPATRPFLYGTRSTTVRDLADYLRGAPIERLFDLAADPREQVDLSRSEPEVVAAIRARLTDAPASAAALELDRDDARRINAQLRELGYVDE